ncbi:MAG: Biopolymer transport protein ExbD/TolR [Ramlibacter sp.]|jgi:biopolymer transport protein ExbD|nr:Biopolymer transport protein ExbD/TolR [Ramlibacter sp.]
MAIRYRQPQEDALIAEINTTPLVDVMLVLLIIFLITVPVVNSSILVSLPREQVQVRETRPENVIVSVDADGAIYWFETRLASPDQLAQRLALVAARQPQPEVHIRGDARADYDSIGRVVFAAQQMGIERIGFITEPPAR